MNVFRRTVHYARVWFRLCWLLRNRSDERAWAQACSKLRDTDVPRNGRYDEISVLDQLASASRMSAANQPVFFCYAYRSVIFKRVAEGKAPVYQSHTRSEAVWSWLTYYDLVPTRFFVARFRIDLLCYHIYVPLQTSEGTSMKSGIKSYHYGSRVIAIPITWQSCNCAIGASLVQWYLG